MREVRCAGGSALPSSAQPSPAQPSSAERAVTWCCALRLYCLPPLCVQVLLGARQVEVKDYEVGGRAGWLLLLPALTPASLGLGCVLASPPPPPPPPPLPSGFMLRPQRALPQPVSSPFLGIRSCFSGPLRR